MFSITGEHDHGPFGGAGVQLVWGDRQDGTLAHISEAERGKSCGCVCPACQLALVGKKGAKVAHHFAHQGGHACAGVRETNAHAWAKRVLEKRLELWLPAGVAIAGTSRRTAFASRRFQFESARLEKRDGSIVPDVVLTASGGRELIVEILVTHACDDAKIQKIRQQGTSALEIDLSALRHADSEELVEAALIGGTVGAAPRTWLHNIKIEHASERLAYELARKVVEREKRQKAEREMATARFIAAARSIRPVSTDATIADMATVSAYGFAELTGIPIEGARGFRVPAKLWQSAIWARALIPASAERGTMIHARDVLRELGDCIAPAFKNEPGGDIKESVRQVEPRFLFPSEAVASFLHKLFLERVLEPEGHDHFRLEDQVSYSLDQRSDQLDAQAKRDQHAKARLRAILENVPADDRDGFSVDRWLTKPIPQLGVRLADIVESGDGWGTLQAAFGEIERLLRGGKPIEVTLGLPIEPAIARAVDREREAAEAAERIRIEAKQRAEREAALADAAQRERYDREVAGYRAQLEAAAKKALGAERAALFMRAHQPALGMSPFARCTDSLGLRHCLALLPANSHSARVRIR